MSSFSYGEDMAITFGVSTAAVNGTKITDAGLFEIMYLTLPDITITIPVLSVLIVAFYCVFKCVCQKTKRENGHNMSQKVKRGNGHDIE